MFAMLSSGIYSDKIRAVVRELSTNGADSHIMFGTPLRPFDVQLPTKLDPQFRIRDFGIGLDDVQVRGEHVCPLGCDHTVLYDDIGPDDSVPCPNCSTADRPVAMVLKQGIYTTYFMSDKDQRNDVTGCLGLGSKSPLAYTDNFTITVWKNGTKRVYNQFLNEIKEPMITLMYEGPSDEESGVELVIAVQEKDFATFEHRAKMVYKWFDIKPNMLGRPDFEFEAESEYLVRTKTFGVVKTKPYDEHSMLVMGNVGYPIRLDDAIRKEFTTTERQLLEHGIVLWVPLGDAMPATSREALQYTDLTIETIKAGLKAAAAGLEQTVRDEFDKCTTLLEARKLMGSMLRDTIVGRITKLGSGADTFGLFKTDAPILFEGKFPNDTINFSYRQFLRMRQRHIGTFVERYTYRKEYHWETIKATRYYMRDKKKSRRGSITTTIFDSDSVGSINVEGLDKIKFVIADETYGLKSRVEKFIADNYEVSDVVVFHENDFLEAFIAEEQLEVGFVSDMPKPERISCGRKQGKTVQALRYCAAGRYTDRAERAYWEEDKDIDLSLGGVYVEVQRYKWSAGTLGQTSCDGVSGPYIENIPAEPCRLHNKYEGAVKLLSLTIDSEYLYGFRKAIVKKVENDSNWIRFDVWLQQKLDAMKHLHVDYRLSQTWDNLNNMNGMAKLIDGEFADDSMFSSFASKMRIIRDRKTDLVVSWGRIYEAFNKLVVDVDETVTNYDGHQQVVKRHIDRLVDRYPLLSTLTNRSGYFNESDVPHIVEYINMIDTAKPISKIVPIPIPIVKKKKVEMAVPMNNQLPTNIAI